MQMLSHEKAAKCLCPIIETGFDCSASHQEKLDLIYSGKRVEEYLKRVRKVMKAC